MEPAEFNFNGQQAIEEAYLEMEAILNELKYPRRKEILKSLPSGQQKTFEELKNETKISVGSLHHHLAKLCEAGLVCRKLDWPHKYERSHFLNRILNIITSNKISDSANLFNQSGEFHCKQLNKDQDEETWVFQKPLTFLGKECDIQIEVTMHYDRDLLTFLMPMYEDGSEGLTGNKLDIFNALIHQFNSKITCGYFTKDTSDGSYAIVFMDHFPSSRMDVDWFKSTLDHFTKIFCRFRPLFDYAISTLGLKFDENAGLEDPVRKYWDERKNELSSLDSG